ncbi:ATP-binding protein [Bradyrhizobium sp. 83012]|uniref:ATP-binding protein n=1 Tax=Bradyrhizobium aeschynomenes TaxID=2734909 RepID=A0ABX2CJZ8_9BRAD|nr:ATP-binding protein [Bradyrhizobium aeschynomenes]NPU67612.1 ATP-binding protein [Bradyrhizobium aeschynomenes]
MSANPPTLHLVCGKIAAGKSTLTAELGRHPATVAVAEDDWLAQLYPGEQTSLADYVRNSSRLRAVMGPHVVALLRAGVSVVLDFPANTLASRAWMRGLFEAAQVPHRLHHLDVSDEICKARLRARNDGGRHAFTVTDEEFDLFTSYFVAPTPEEGFDVIVHQP